LALLKLHETALFLVAHCDCAYFLINIVYYVKAVSDSESADVLNQILILILKFCNIWGCKHVQ